MFIKYFALTFRMNNINMFQESKKINIQPIKRYKNTILVHKYLNDQIIKPYITQ